MVAIGIDLGTTSSCAAVCKQGAVKVIENELGNRVTPSYVAFTPKQRLIGETAKIQAHSNARNTIFAAKRLLGRKYDDIGVQLDKRHWPFKIINDNGKPKILVSYKGRELHLAPEEVSGMILFRMKQIAEVHLGEKVSECVITVPAYFNDAQRQATRTAGAIAGLNVLRIINEPTAAALAYGFNRELKGDKNILIYDLGGGTFDVSVLTVADGAIFEVKSTAGNTRLGGEDFDNRLVAYFMEDFRKKYHLEVTDMKSLRRLRTASEKAKRILSSADVAFVEIDALESGIDYSGKISRDIFEELCLDLFQDTINLIGKALGDAGLFKNDIHQVVLVGGSTRILKIQQMIKEFFGTVPVTCSINADEAVACGAAIQAAILSGECNHKIQSLLLVDVVPLTLGVETARGIMYPIVERNTPIPYRNTKEMTTLEDYQTCMTVEVFEGERSLTKDNNLLGVFELNSIPPAPRGVPKIDITFDVDVNGVLSVMAQDRSTGNVEGIVITSDSRLNKEEIARMIADAEAYREEDRENKKRLEAKNQLETYIYEVKQTINEKSDRFSDNEKTVIMTQIQEAVTWLNHNVDCLREEYDKKITELMIMWSPILRKYYVSNMKHRTKRQRLECNQVTENGENGSATIEEIEEE